MLVLQQPRKCHLLDGSGVKLGGRRTFVACGLRVHRGGKSRVSGLPSSLVLPTLASIAASRRSGRKPRTYGVFLRAAVADESVTSDSSLQNVPQDLYELLGVDSGAETSDIKKAYYDKMKICHPDVAGEEGVEMCMLLNDAWDVLSDPKQKEAYDAQVGESSSSIATMTPSSFPTPTDTSPTWEWTPKSKKPVWTAKPLSRSNYDKVAAEDAGEKWRQQKFVYVDEWTCIGCRNCCDVAPKTFCIEADIGRARVYTQWGNSEEYLDYAVLSCPVDCIYWVSRDELQALEYVTRDTIYESGNSLPCSMAIRQGTGPAGPNPFDLAVKFKEKLKREELKRQRESARNEGAGGWFAAANSFHQRIQNSFAALSDSLRRAGWG